MTYEEILLPIIVVLNLTYVYFWLVVVYARLNKHIDVSNVTDWQIRREAIHAQQHNDPHLFTIQITTKGGSLPVVKRGIMYVLQAVKKYPVLKELVVVEIITEDGTEAIALTELFADAAIPVTAFILPADYETPEGTKLKARALHYMVEQHRKNPRDAYIVHYDEESVFTPDNLARLVYKLLSDPIGISEGTISYALDWQDAHPICRTMESNRPFGCHECYLMMTHPAPLHLHGSNLVIQERLENEIGWDIGLYNGNPLIAEDLVFGLMVYLKFGASVFGWHGVEMIEQPPFTLKAAYKQRERWVMGALQGVSHVRQMQDWKQIHWLERWKIQTIIHARVLTYGIGLPVSIISLLIWTGISASNLLLWGLTGHTNIHITYLAIPGLILWLGANQIGLRQNLSYTTMTRWQKLLEHIKILLMTPFAGLYDTAGPFVAICKWVTGTRGIVWHPTPKLQGQEIK